MPEPINEQLLVHVVELETELNRALEQLSARDLTIRDLENQLRTGANRDATLREAVGLVVAEHGDAELRARQYRVALETVANELVTATITSEDLRALVDDALGNDGHRGAAATRSAPAPS